MAKAQIGTIIHGTGRAQDLLRAFARELERLSEGQAIPPIVAEARGYADIIDADGGTDSEAEDALDVLADLADNYLNPLAPEGCYFGAHEGDGSDFGFWPHD